MNPPSAQPPRRLTGVRLAGTGMAVPGSPVTNDDLAQRVDTSDEWISQRTGIKQRYLLADGTGERELAKRAVLGALQQAGTEPSQLEMLICATMTPEMVCPSNAARLVADVGAVPAGALDVNAACSGFVCGVNLAAALVGSGCYRNAVVVGVEALSRITDWTDRRTCVLFGDGAGAAVFTASDDARQGCLHQAMGSDGRQWQQLYVPRGPHHVPQGEEFNGKFNTLQMNGREVYKFAVTTLQRSIEEALEAAGLAVNDLAMVVPHQSNRRILESACEKLGLPPEKLYINIDRYGNTSAASVPICLHELHQAGRLKAGDYVLFTALGGGLTWASSLWRL